MFIIAMLVTSFYILPLLWNTRFCTIHVISTYRISPGGTSLPAAFLRVSYMSNVQLYSNCLTLQPHQSMQLAKHAHADASVSCTHLSRVTDSTAQRLFAAMASTLLHMQLRSSVQCFGDPSFSTVHLFVSLPLSHSRGAFSSHCGCVLLFVKVAEVRLPHYCCHLSPLSLFRSSLSLSH